ncbi:MAG: SMI1/KNR4 family protein [Oxalobacter formigenes]|nr:SMI1/KNR4 family protein [Oxalobacter formigenes]MCM1281512.1 SMI1/KNR4 family protein [Alistipes senegalensis]MCM1513098.1 SMI1/KNR4 family protein [Oxalobacter formigenes]
MGRFTDLIRQHVNRYAHLGAETAPNGAVCTGYVRHVPGGAWLHTAYPPLTEEGVRRMVRLIRRKLPGELHEFYLEANGLGYMLDTLILAGLPESAVRTPDAPPMPYSIEALDGQDRPGDARDDMVFFGAYDYDFSRLYMREDDSRVFYCAFDSAEPIGEWPSLYDCLRSEFGRIDSLRNRNGELFDLECSPLPFGRT